VQRKLAQASSRIKEIRDELCVVEDQLAALTDDADDKSLRALVSETPVAGHEYREAQRHADAMRRHRDGLVSELADLEARINELLDKMEPAP
jgi:chromosome segregation ATPase